MRSLELDLPDVKMIELDVHGDDRGFFVESWNSKSFLPFIGEVEFVQDNHSKSQRGVLRGLHYQLDRPQGKLVRVVRGSIYDVVLDIRPASVSFGRWLGIELSEGDGRQLWVPPGFAHGFLTLVDDTEVLYKVTDFYSPTGDRSILWSDPDLAIDWPDTGSGPHLSAKDSAAPRLADAELRQEMG